MIELILDTCSDILNVILIKDRKMLIQKKSEVISKHSVSLLPFIDEVLSCCHYKLSDVDCFCVVVGSGSFTGIRIGIATVKAFCSATNKKAKAVTSLQALAYTIASGENLIALCDAKQNKVYLQEFNNNLPVSEIISVEISQLENILLGYNNCKIYSNIPIDVIDCIYIRDSTNGLICACELSPEIDGSLLNPCYVRRPQAEENLK